TLGRRPFVSEMAVDILAPSPPNAVVQGAGETHVGERKVRIEVERPPQPLLRLAVLVAGKLLIVPNAPHAMIESIEVGGVLACRSPPFSQEHLGFDCSDHTLCDLILQGEDIGEIAVKALGTAMIAVLRH